MTETPWDPSLVDPTNREFDGLILRSVGGRTGPVTLENGQRISFPFKAQQEVAGSTPPNIGAEHQAAGSTMRLVIQGGAAFGGTPEISMLAPLPGSLVPPSITLIDDLLATPSANSIVLGGTAGGVQIDGQSLTINSAGALSLASDDSITLTTTGAGDDITLDAAGAVDITADGTITITSGSGQHVTITASGSGDLSLTGSPVLINSVDVSTALGGWGNHTPTLRQNGVRTSTVTRSVACKLGRLVVFEFYLVCTQAGTAGNVIDVSLPYTAAANTNVVGSWYFYDSGGGVNRTCVAALNSTTTVSGVMDGSSGYFGASVYTKALAVGDAILGKVIYEAAA